MPSPFKDRIDQAIAEHGHMVFGIFPAEPTDPPPYAYTVGLVEAGWPELFVVGLQPQECAALIEAVIGHYRRNELKPRAGDLLTEIIPDYTLRIEATEHTPVLEDMTTQAHAHYDRPLTFCQVVWPDVESRFPDDPAFDPRLQHIQTWWRE